MKKKCSMFINILNIWITIKWLRVIFQWKIYEIKCFVFFSLESASFHDIIKKSLIIKRIDIHPTYCSDLVYVFNKIQDDKKKTHRMILLWLWKKTVNTLQLNEISSNGPVWFISKHVDLFFIWLDSIISYSAWLRCIC